MAKGRPPLGPQLVERIQGSDLARLRLKVVLESIAGRVSVQEACRQLGIRAAAFHKLRARVLESALESLEPAPVGRPRLQTDQDPEMTRLQEENLQLRIDLRASQIREEIALVMPHLLKERAQEVKKNKPKDPPPSGADKRGWWRGWRKPGK